MRAAAKNVPTKLSALFRGARGVSQLRNGVFCRADQTFLRLYVPTALFK